MTSPEYHMKRLLAAGSGPIFQLCRSFRNEEAGRHHNPEFTMLEWYRPHYDMYRLMNEVDDLLQQVLDCGAAETLSYQQAFIRHLEVDPLSADKTQLREVADKLGVGDLANREEDRDTLLQLLFMMGVEPHIGKEKPAFVYHFRQPKPRWRRSAPKIIAWQSVLRSISKGLSWRMVSGNSLTAASSVSVSSRITASVPRGACRNSRLILIFWMRWRTVCQTAPA